MIKLDFNWLFNPNSWNLIKIGVTKLIKNRHNFIKTCNSNWKKSILIRNDWICLKMVEIWLFPSLNQLFRSFNRLYWCFNWSFNQKLVEFNWKEIKNWLNSIKKIKKRLEIEIDDRIMTLQSKSSYNCCPNLMESNLELLMIWLWAYPICPTLAMVLLQSSTI